MAWIESHTVLIRHPKLMGLAREARLRPAYAMGHLHALWHAALEMREDGDLSSWTDETIAALSDFPGDAPQWVRLLQKYGWLDDKLIHDWLDYAGRYLVARYRTKDPVRLATIWKVHGQDYGSKDGPRSDQGPTPDGLPDQTQPDQTNQQQRPSSGQGRPTKARKAREPYSEAFEAFWAVYPRKDAKVAAWAAWQRAMVAPEDLERILGAVRSKAATPDWTKEGGRYVPLPTTYLNQRRWEDQGTAVKDPLRPSAAPSKYDNLTEVV